MHLVITFPGDPNTRNYYIKEFVTKDTDDLFGQFDLWASKLVKNKHSDFSFVNYKQII